MMKKLIVAAGVMACAWMAGGVVQAQNVDPYPPPPPIGLDVTAFSTVCINDAPWIDYRIVPVGFTPTTPTARLTIMDVNGNVIEVRDPAPLSGQFLYPGAAVDAQGRGTAWPGWVFENGVWRELPAGEGTAVWRQGVTIRVDVNPTAFAEVEYPDASPVCADPKTPQTPPPGDSPSQGTPPSELPRTGSSGTNAMVQIAAGLVIAGGLLAVGAHRRRSAAGA